jgi:hypothetical protein
MKKPAEGISHGKSQQKLCGIFLFHYVVILVALHRLISFTKIT